MRANALPSLRGFLVFLLSFGFEITEQSGKGLLIGVEVFPGRKIADIKPKGGNVR